MDNGAVPVPSRRRIRGSRQAAHRRRSRNRALSSHRQVSQILGRSSVVLYMERHLAHRPHSQFVLQFLRVFFIFTLDLKDMHF